jgi:hypothetical protein
VIDVQMGEVTAEAEFFRWSHRACHTILGTEEAERSWPSPDQFDLAVLV